MNDFPFISLLSSENSSTITQLSYPQHVFQQHDYVRCCWLILPPLLLSSGGFYTRQAKQFYGAGLCTIYHTYYRLSFFHSFIPAVSTSTTALASFAIDFHPFTPGNFNNKNSTGFICCLLSFFHTRNLVNNRHSTGFSLTLFNRRIDFFQWTWHLLSFSLMYSRQQTERQTDRQ